MAVLADRLDSPAELQLVAAYREAGRRRIVRWVFVVYWLLIFEGALRKWVAPGHELILFFIRDPFVLWIYLLTLKYRLWPKAYPLLVLGVALAVFCVVLPFLQMLIGGLEPRYLLLGGYGWRNYFYYLPLAFIIGDLFRWEDLERLVRYTLIVAVPAAVLVAIQFASPWNAVVNLGSALDEEHQFGTLGVAFGIIRPTGFFSATTGQVNFVSSLFALALSVWLVPRLERPVGPLLLWAATAAAATMMALSGSRGLFLHAAIVFASAGALVFLVRREGVAVRAGILPALLAVAGLLLFPVLFPSSYDAFLQRWQDAYVVESRYFEGGIWGRALSGFYRFLVVIPQVPVLGHMLGIGANAARRLPWVEMPVIEQPAWLGGGTGIEDPWSSHIAELGPLFGVLFIAYRVGFTVWLGLRSIRATWYRGHPLPLLLFSYVGVVMPYGFISGQGSIHGFAWLFAGFCMAASRLDDADAGFLQSRRFTSPAEASEFRHDGVPGREIKSTRRRAAEETANANDQAGP